MDKEALISSSTFTSEGDDDMIRRDEVQCSPSIISGGTTHAQSEGPPVVTTVPHSSPTPATPTPTQRHTVILIPVSTTVKRYRPALAFGIFFIIVFFTIKILAISYRDTEDTTTYTVASLPDNSNFNDNFN